MGGATSCCGPNDSEKHEQMEARKENAPGAAVLPKVEEDNPPMNAPRSVSEAPASRIYDIKLDKTSGERLGVDVDHQDGNTLLVEAIHEGLVQNWNNNNRGNEVKVGDRIFEVNGVKGDVLQLVDECKKNQVLQMKLKSGEA
mmetsp:Transcript_121411/g.220809  ORF Transcript_121411/g.220809 Transcript_121411/m.220809 type:complete len:142 (-) Transcript_121411:53-478(-)